MSINIKKFREFLLRLQRESKKDEIIISIQKEKGINNITKVRNLTVYSIFWSGGFYGGIKYRSYDDKFFFYGFWSKTKRYPMLEQFELNLECIELLGKDLIDAMKNVRRTYKPQRFRFYSNY